LPANRSFRPDKEKIMKNICRFTCLRKVPFEDMDGWSERMLESEKKWR
jgi:hypothetical protein